MVRRVIFFALAAALAFAAASAAAKKRQRAGKPAAEKFTAGADTVKLVEYFVKTETGDLNFELVPAYMEVDPLTLPGRLRVPYRAKKAELEALKKIAEGKRKPPVRRAGKEELGICPREEGGLRYVEMLKTMGFEPINELEEQFLMRRTKCSECELQEEFTLKIVIIPPGKKGKKHTQYLFLSRSDPLMALVAKYRKGSEGGTDFFGTFVGVCR